MVDVRDNRNDTVRPAPLYLIDTVRAYLESRLPAIVEYAQLLNGEDTGRRLVLIRKKTAAGSLCYHASDIMLPLGGEDSGHQWGAIAKAQGLYAMVNQFDRS